MDICKNFHGVKIDCYMVVDRGEHQAGPLGGGR